MNPPPAATEYGGLRELLRRPDPLLCAFATIPDPGVAAILGASGFDVVVLDGEHGPFTRASARGCVDALARTPAKAVMRVVGNDPATIKEALDLGVDGILVPMVGDAEEASAAVRATRFPPEGSRGVGAGHASRYGTNLEAYLTGANANVAVLATIETAAGVECAAQIAAVDGLDGILIGPTDLAADLGLLGRPDDGRLQGAIATVTGAARAAGIPVGLGCDPGDVSQRTREGMTLFACYSDGSGLGAGAAAAVAAATATA